MFELLELPVAGVAVFIEGDPGDAFYILVSGSVAVQQGGVELAQLHSEGKGRSAREDGCFFGEMSLIDAKPRIATVRTLGPTKLLVLRAPMFHAFLDRVPDFKRKVVEQQGRRNIDNQYQSRNRSAGACGLELEFGACAGMMRGASPTQGAVFADTYQRKHADEITLRRTRELLRAPQ